MLSAEDVPEHQAVFLRLEPVRTYCEEQLVVPEREVAQEPEEQVVPDIAWQYVVVYLEVR